MTASPIPAPFGATDVMALVLLTLAFVFWVQSRRSDHEPGLGWCALAMGLVGIWIGADALHVPVDPAHVRQTWWFLPALGGITALCVGVTDYLHTPPRLRTLALVLLITPLAIAAGISAYVTLTGALINRVWIAVMPTLSFVGLSALSWWTSKREPDVNHRVLTMAFAMVPIHNFVQALKPPALIAGRYWGALMLTIIGMTLLAVVLTRRYKRMELEIARRTEAEKELVELNGSLESTVELRTRELRELVRALESFNRSVSHDLRGPLGGISGLASLALVALDTGDAPRARKLLTPIIDQAESTTRMVSALLSLAQTSNAPISRQTVDLKSLVKDISDMHVSTQNAASPTIDIGDLPTVKSDPDLLRIVLTNLINNAVKFTRGKSHGQVSVRSKAVEGGIEVSVHDNGVGFDSAVATRLFEPFQRMHGREFEGHGIGLSIVQRAVERLGGTVKAVGQVGAGATFIVTLPQEAEVMANIAHLATQSIHTPVSPTLH